MDQDEERGALPGTSCVRHEHVAYHGSRPSLFDLVRGPSSVSRDGTDGVRFRATDEEAERIRRELDGGAVVERLHDGRSVSPELRAALERVSMGLTDAAETWRIVRGILAAPAHGPLVAVLSALTSHVWEVVSDRRRDGDLRLLHDLLHRAAALVGVTRPTVAVRFKILADLVHQSVRVAEVGEISDLEGRRQARRLVTVLAEAPDGVLPSEDVMATIGPSRAANARVLDLCRHGGLVERVGHDGRRLVRLTVDGLAMAARVREELSPEGDEGGPGAVAAVSTSVDIPRSGS